jgi:PAS domain S-box-containing protein
MTEPGSGDCAAASAATENARAEAALAAAWPALIELVGPVYVADGEGRILYRNDGFAKLLEPALADRDGRLPAALVQRVRLTPAGVRRTERLGRGDQLLIFECRHRAAADGALLLGAFTEVTRAQEALVSVRRLRARHEEILSTVSDWVWELDRDWTFRRSSTRNDQVLGFDPGFVVGQDFFETGTVEEDPRRPQRRPLKRRQRAPFDGVHYRLTTPDGEARLFALSAIPQFDEDSGDFAGFLGSARDVTAEVAADRRARDYRDELERALAALQAKNAELDAALERATAADRAKNEFLAMVGHELRTPLNAVIGFSEMMDGEVFGPLGNDRYDAYVDDILASSRHLLGVINDIIDVVKLELRELSLQPDEIAVPKFLETCAAFVRERARRQGIALEVAAAEPLPPLIADPQKARQMLINLLGNALKFTPQGGRVRLTARLEGDQVALAVADTGCGIAPDRIAAVLEPFRQADSSLARSHEGLGLGLPLTRQLAELHGGRLALDSAEGAGTTATVYLPREPALDGA